MRVRLLAVVLTAALPPLTGCATLRSTLSGWERGPDGISESQHRMRDALSRGDFDALLASHEDDALLDALTAGVASFYAARYARSGAILDSATSIADDRITASVSRNALSLVTNDMARPYRPRRTERLFIAYYGMLSFVQLAKWEDAAVEARRMVSLLAQYQEDRDDAERPLHAAMEYLAGAVFERAGEAGEAMVAYRAAHAMASTRPVRPQPRDTTDGEVLVVVERGFVAHRTTQTISIRLEDEECDSIRSERVRSRVARRFVDRIDGVDARVVVTSPDSAPRAAGSPVAALVLAPVADASMRRQAEQVGWMRGRPRGRDDDDDDDHDGRRLTIAISELRRSTPWASGELRLIADGAGTPELHLSASVDDATGVDERRERLGMVARAVARAATKYAVTRAVRENKGKVAGTVAEVGARLLERADVRSWHLLPQELELIRLRVRPGTRVLWLEVGSGSGARQLRIPNVAVEAGSLTLVPVRLWRDAQLETVPTEIVGPECVMLECR
jgi:hypothetical protein